MNGTNDGSEMRVAIAWHGLPYYGARLLQPVVSELAGRISVIATPGPQSREEIEAALGLSVLMAPPNPTLTWQELGIPIPHLFFETGWAHRNFRSLGSEVKRHGGIVVCMVDNTCKHNLRQAAGKYVFRFRYRPHIDVVLVPGASGLQLMKEFGMPDSCVYTGLYGADPNTFQAGPPLIERPYHFLFVGQFISRKGLHGLVNAVNSLRKAGKIFRIAAVGAGPLQASLESVGIEVYPFSSAQTISRLMQQCRFLILPSLEDHWGLVVHEAALSGCGLILSKAVGAHLDLLNHRNGFLCEPGSPEPAMWQALSSDSQWLIDSRTESLRLATQFGPQPWLRTFKDIYLHAERARERVLTADPKRLKERPINHHA